MTRGYFEHSLAPSAGGRVRSPRTRRWWRAAQIVGWIHCVVLAVVLVGMAARLPSFAGSQLAIGALAVAVVAAVVVALIVATWKVRRRVRGGLVGLVVYAIVGVALCGQLAAGALMSAERLGGIGYVLAPIGLVLLFLATAAIPTVAYLLAGRPDHTGRRS